MIHWFINWFKKKFQGVFTMCASGVSYYISSSCFHFITKNFIIECVFECARAQTDGKPNWIRHFILQWWWLDTCCTTSWPADLDQVWGNQWPSVCTLTDIYQSTIAQRCHTCPKELSTDAHNISHNVIRKTSLLTLFEFIADHSLNGRSLSTVLLANLNCLNQLNNLTFDGNLFDGDMLF